MSSAGAALRLRCHEDQHGGARGAAVDDAVLFARRREDRLTRAQLLFLAAHLRDDGAVDHRVDLVTAGVGVRLLGLARLEAIDVEEHALRLEEVHLVQLFRGERPTPRAERRYFHVRGSSGATPASWKRAMSRSYSGLPVVSSFSPKKTEFAPAIMQRSCASSLICSRPAESRTIARGIKSRAVAMMRTTSTVPTGATSAKGVPRTRTSMLMGTDSGCGSCAASVTSMAQRSSIDSPMPMIPPARTCRSVRRRSSYVRVVMISPYFSRLVSRLWL